MSITTTQNLRKINKEKIIQALHDYGESNKNQLAEYTSLSVGTCYNVLQELLKTKEVIRGNGFASTGGRKAKSYKLNENFYQILTVSFHRKFQKVYYVSRVYNYIEGQIYENVSPKVILDFDDFCLSMQNIIQQYENIMVIAISFPGVISKEGTIEEISLIKGLEKLSHISIKRELELRFHKKVIIENDVNVAAVGYYSCHKSTNHVGFLYQPQDDLAGMAFIVNGQLMKGMHGLVGEVPFLPWLTQEQQYEYLKTKEGIYQLLSQLIVMIMITNDPEEIVIECQGINEQEKLIEEIRKYIPYSHFIPHLTFIDDIKSFIFKGLILMSRESLTTNLVMTTQKVY